MPCRLYSRIFQDSSNCQPHSAATLFTSVIREMGKKRWRIYFEDYAFIQGHGYSRDYELYQEVEYYLLNASSLYYVWQCQMCEFVVAVIQCLSIFFAYDITLSIFKTIHFDDLKEILTVIALLRSSFWSPHCLTTNNFAIIRRYQENITRIYNYSIFSLSKNTSLYV